MWDEEPARPGPPHIIRWVTPWEATIADEAGVIAVLRVSPAAPFDLLLVREPQTEAGRELLRRSLSWALEEYAQRLLDQGEQRPSVER